MISKLKFMMAFAFIFLASVIYAQVPQLFNYQGIARDAKGNPMGNQRIALKISVLPASDATSPEYQETQLVTTNEFGLYNLQIGNGQALSGEMKTVKWETGNKYIQVAIDPKGGSNFEVAGTSQLLSVPYALYADKAGSSHEKTRTGAVSSNAAHVAGDVNYLTKFTAYNTIGKSQLFDNGSSVGIGTATPGGKLHIYSNSNSVVDLLRMHNAHTTGSGRFIMYNDIPAAYATFTKYGSTFPGGYTGMASLYPYANLLAFGNNGMAQGDGNGRFLISTSGNVGISMYKGGSKLKFHADYATLNVAIGGNTIPVSRVHFSNTDSTYMDLRLTNNLSGHTATDGLVIAEVGGTASIINLENSTLSLGTNNATQMTFTGAGNVGVGTTTPTAKLDVNGQVRIQGGTPGAGKVLTSDATGLATWQTPSGAGIISGNGTTNYIPMFTPNGTTLGNSKLRQGGNGYGVGNPNELITFNSNYNYARYVVNSPKGGYSGFIVGDSAASISGYSDSIVYFFKTPEGNTLIGNDNSNILITRKGKVQMAPNLNVTSGNAQLNVNTNIDTAGYFTSSSTNQINNGILRAEYKGSTLADHVAIYGKTSPGGFWGYGVIGEGGWQGVKGIATDINSHAGVFGLNNGNGAGVYAQSTGGNGLFALTSSPNNSKSAVLADASSSKGVAVRAIADSNHAGIFTAGRSINSPSLANGVLRGEYTGSFLQNAVGVFGVSRPSNASNKGIGVQGEGGWVGLSGMAISSIGEKAGVRGEAIGAGVANFGVYGDASGATTNYAGYFVGTLYATTGTFGTKPFMIDHPLDPTNKFLRHSSIESNDMMNVYNGNVVTDANGYATVTMPDYFEALNENFKYQLTVIDNSNDFVMAKITKEVQNNQFQIRTSQPNVKVSWQVAGVRHDAVAKKYPIIVEENKPEGQKGFYIEPEAYGQPKTMGANNFERIKAESENSNSKVDYKADTEKMIKESKAMQDELNRREELQKEAQKNWKVQETPKSNQTTGTQNR